MTRTGWIGFAIALLALALVAWFAWVAMRPIPAITIDTENAKVSIGEGGVSISVAPSSAP